MKRTLTWITMAAALGAAMGCESGGGTTEPTGGTTPPVGGDGSITVKKPAYADGTLMRVVRHEGPVPLRIETKDVSTAAEVSVDGKAAVALTKASDYAFEGSWTVAKADTGPHTLTFTVTGKKGTTTLTHAVDVLVWDRHEDIETRSFSGLSPVLEVDEASKQMWLLYRTNVGEVEIDMARKPLDGGSWKSEVVVADANYELADGGGHNTWHLSMDLDSKGNPHFASVWDKDGDNMVIGMGYFHFDGTAWQKEMAVPALEKLDPAQADAFPYYSWEGSNVTVTVDKADAPHIVYYRNLATTAAKHNGSIWYATKDGDAWKNEELTSNLGDINQPVGFDRMGLASAWDDPGKSLMVRFATHESDEGSLKYALKTDAGWKLGVIDEEYEDYSWDRGSESSLVYAGGKWYTSFHAVYGTTNLYLATWDGSAWTKELVDEKGLGEYSALQVTADGRKYVTYRGAQNTLRLAWNDGTGWRATELGIETEVEQVRLGDPGQTQIFVDAGGTGHVAFYNAYKKIMEYWTAPLGK